MRLGFNDIEFAAHASVDVHGTNSGACLGHEQPRSGTSDSTGVFEWLWIRRWIYGHGRAENDGLPAISCDDNQPESVIGQLRREAAGRLYDLPVAQPGDQHVSRTVRQRTYRRSRFSLDGCRGCRQGRAGLGDGCRWDGGRRSGDGRRSGACRRSCCRHCGRRRGGRRQTSHTTRSRRAKRHETDRENSDDEQCDTAGDQKRNPPTPLIAYLLFCHLTNFANDGVTLPGPFDHDRKDLGPVSPDDLSECLFRLVVR